MRKHLRRLHVLSISLGIVAAIGFVYNIVILGMLFPRVERFDPIGTQWETAGIVVGVSLFVIALFHLSGVLTLLLSMLARRAASWRLAAIIFLGVISGILILADLTMLQEIGKQYAQRWHSTGEWIILFTSSGLHALFIGLALPALLSNLREQRSPEAEPMLKDHVLFQLTHITGLLCGSLGLAALIAALAFQVPTGIVEQTVFVLGSLVLAPYLLILLTWLWSKRKEGIREWFDEKQFQDLARASLAALLVSLPIMILLYWQQRAYPADSLWPHVWLPAYLFITLLTFSAGTLFLSRD